MTKNPVTKKFPIYDYAQVIDSFIEKLKGLEAHIRAHRTHTCWKRDANQIKKARSLLSKARKEWLDNKEQKAYEQAFKYIAKNLQGWWC